MTNKEDNTVDESNIKSIAMRVADNIVADIADRKGLGDAWEDIDFDAQYDIREVWAKHIADALSCQKEQIIMKVGDEAGGDHFIYGDDFAAFALNDVFEKLKSLEEKKAKAEGYIQ